MEEVLDGVAPSFEWCIEVIEQEVELGTWSNDWLWVIRYSPDTIRRGWERWFRMFKREPEDYSSPSRALVGYLKKRLGARVAKVAKSIGSRRARAADYFRKNDTPPAGWGEMIFDARVSCVFADAAPYVVCDCDWWGFSAKAWLHVLEENCAAYIRGGSRAIEPDQRVVERITSERAFSELFRDDAEPFADAWWAINPKDRTDSRLCPGGSILEAGSQ